MTVYLSGDLANLIGISDQTVRRWVEEGKIPPPAQKTPRGLRVWTQAQIDEIMAKVRSGKLKPERIM